MKNKIVCPHCKHEYSDKDMYQSPHDLWDICPQEECVTEFCVSCEEEFYIKGGYIPEYNIYECWEDYDENN